MWWFRCALKRMAEALCNNVYLSLLCIEMRYQDLHVLASQAWICRHRSCAEYARFANTSRANIAGVKCFLPLDPTGCARGVIQTRGRHSPQPDQCRACKHACACVSIKSTLERGARAHSLCTHSGNCARHDLTRKYGAQVRGRPPHAILVCCLVTSALAL